MNERKIRFLLWAGGLGYIVLFAGDMLYYGAWGSGRDFLSNDLWNSIMTGVPLWRHHLGSVTGPVGIAFELIGLLGLWFCCRRASPRLAVAMLAFFYVDGVFSVLQHGIFGPMGFAMRFCGVKSAAVTEIWKLNDLLGKPQLVGWIVGSAIWIFLALKKKAGVPRWTVLFCPLLSYWLYKVAVYIPAPLGMPLNGGWGNFVAAIWFAVLAITYKDASSKEGGSA
jgi:hypothetical protein